MADDPGKETTLEPSGGGDDRIAALVERFRALAGERQAG